MTIIPAVPSENVLPVSVVDEQLLLFGKQVKPASIDVDYLEEGTITLPLTAIKVGEGNYNADVELVEDHKEGKLALLKANDKKLFAFVPEETKAGDKVKFAVDYSQATFKDKEEKVVCLPLPERDHVISRFVKERIHNYFLSLSFYYSQSKDIRTQKKE